MHRIGDACLINPEKASGGLPFVSPGWCIYMQVSMWIPWCAAMQLEQLHLGCRLARSWRSTNNQGGRRMRYCWRSSGTIDLKRLLGGGRWEASLVEVRFDVPCWLLAAQKFHGEKELFESDHADEVHKGTIIGKAFVHSLKKYEVSKIVRPISHLMLRDSFTVQDLGFHVKGFILYVRPENAPSICSPWQPSPSPISSLVFSTG